MKEAIVHNADKVEIVDSPIPQPGADQVVIKVIVSGSNPKDWKTPEWMSKPHNSGDDIAGIVHAVGKGVYEFKPGDRVAAFHEMTKEHGSFAEYAVAWAHTTSHIPESMSFEEAATVPLAALTAVIGNYVRLGLPAPWAPATTEKIPLIVYGAASAVGAYAIQLAQLSNVHPVIGIAGKGIPYAEGLIDKSKGDAIVDYRKGDESLRQQIKDALKNAGVEKCALAFDAVAEKGSHENLVAVLDSHSRVTNVLPTERFATPGFKWPDTYDPVEWTMVGDVHGAHPQVGFVYFRWLFRMAQEGKFKAHPPEVIPGGLAGVSQGLQNLKNGRASAVKYVFKIEDTEGAGKN
ncbi:GroES-like protein [Saccharata proteae CBS 121410]|uniref:GroES-like protein n=1 Tax=Saccharata proteae CBS 121410 TaxID=1314787 RepID=A0A9P4HZU0_9PEZI|nr:GroES-like protein [Saccharata proteae CBS 121410]